MGAAAYNRGTKLIASDADGQMATANVRADRAALSEENAHLKSQIRSLHRELARARRCIAELRRSKDALMADARTDAASSAAAISVLCRIAFPEDQAAGQDA